MVCLTVALPTTTRLNCDTTKMSTESNSISFKAKFAEIVQAIQDVGYR